LTSSVPFFGFGSQKYQNYINGEFRDSSATKWYDIRNPATQDLVAKVPQSTDKELNEAVDTAAEAYKTWSKTPILTRQRFMLDLQAKIRRDMDILAELITKENGKTLADARGDVTRGLEVVEHACGLSHLNMGETVENISRGIDCYSYRIPLGVCAGIPAFNFPAMIPLWMFPYAITLGNTFVIKPSERVAGSTMHLAKLCHEIGIPKGVFSVIHGDFHTTKFLCENPTIKALSFVGGNKAGDFIYETGSKNNKRMQVNMGAKNHGVIMPDADEEDALNAICAAAFGAAGQRCMALPVAVFVGTSKNWIPKLVEKA
jgi:malonate-semialdehyde dehydrogenase (acetylating) / methylmalonate-semialdehyde dehydrogenase